MLSSGQLVKFRHSNLVGVDKVLADATVISGICYINNSDTGVDITITRVALGEYDVSFICPTLHNTDLVQVKIYDTTDGWPRETLALQEVVNVSATPTVTITITTATDIPIGSASIWVTTDLLGTEQITGFMLSNIYGKVQTTLVLGVTYYLWATCPGYQSIQGQEFVAALDNTFILQEQVLPLTEINSYVTIAYADAYLTTRLFSEQWFLATEIRKTAALVQATKIIDTLSFRGLRELTEQTLAWPRVLEIDTDAVIPNEIYMACCEIALSLINGINPEQEFRNVNKTSQGYGLLRSTKNTEMVDPHLVHGVPSITAFNLLRPYLTDITQSVMFRGT